MNKEKVIEKIDLALEKSSSYRDVVTKVLDSVRCYVETQVGFEYYPTMQYIEMQMSSKLGGSAIGVNRALNFLKEELKSESRREKNELLVISIQNYDEHYIKDVIKSSDLDDYIQYYINEELSIPEDNYDSIEVEKVEESNLVNIRFSFKPYTNTFEVNGKVFTSNYPEFKQNYVVYYWPFNKETGINNFKNKKNEK